MSNRIETKTYWPFGLFFLLVLMDSVSGSFPKAENVTWSSFNFKTLLTWDPKPVNYSYTVEFSPIGQNRERSPFCIRTMATECDLTFQLKDLKATYNADVLSEPMRDATSDLIEFPHTRSEKFSPYKDTIIGRPEFKIEVSKDKRSITLYITDPPTAIFNDQNKPLNIREIFMDDLQYRVIYKKASSTGKKVKDTKSSQVQLTDVDQGQSYCFNVQAYIPSRSMDKQLGELSHTQCSPEEGKSPLEEYSIGVIAGGILLIIVVVVVAVAVTVVCCKRKRNAKNGGKGDVI